MNHIETYRRRWSPANPHGGIAFPRSSREAFGHDQPLRPFSFAPRSGGFDPERHVVGPICAVAALVFVVLVALGLA